MYGVTKLFKRCARRQSRAFELYSKLGINKYNLRYFHVQLLKHAALSKENQLSRRRDHVRLVSTGPMLWSWQLTYRRILLAHWLGPMWTQHFYTKIRWRQRKHSFFGYNLVRLILMSATSTLPVYWWSWWNSRNSTKEINQSIGL